MAQQNGDPVLKNINETNIQCSTVVVTEDSSAHVTFVTPFVQVPNVVVSPQSTDSDHQATVANIDKNGFDVYLNKSGGGAADDIPVQWIATDDGVV